MGRKGRNWPYLPTVYNKLSVLYLEPFVEVGFVRKGLGYAGHVRVVIHEGFEQDIREQSFLFFEIDGYKVPFFLEEKSFESDCVIKFEHLDSVEEVRRLKQSKLYMLEKDIRHGQEFLSKRKLHDEWVGFQVIDTNTGVVGKIVRVEEYPQQEMAIVEPADKSEILIPLHDGLIERVMTKAQEIHMNLPEGLI